VILINEKCIEFCRLKVNACKDNPSIDLSLVLEHELLQCHSDKKIKIKLFDINDLIGE